MVWSLVLLNWISLAENKYFHKQTLLNWDFFLWHFCMQFLIPHSPNWSFFFSPLVLYKNIKRKRINKQIQSLPSSLFLIEEQKQEKKSNDLSKVKKASLWQSYSWNQAQDFTCGFQSWRIATYLTDLLLSPGYLHIYIHAATLQISKSPGLEWRHSGLMSERKAVPVMRKPAATGEMRLNPFSKSLWDTT